MAGGNIYNSLHESNGKYVNLNTIKSQLHYRHAEYYSCSYVVSSSHEYFMETDLHSQISQHQARLKHENFTVSYHSYPHYYRKKFCSYSYILVVHFTASSIRALQKLELVGIVSYHYMFQILKCF